MNLLMYNSNNTYLELLIIVQFKLIHLYFSAFADCMDTIHYCDYYDNKGYCSDERFIDYMTRNCPKTCGMCEPGIYGRTCY